MAHLLLARATCDDEIAPWLAHQSWLSPGEQQKLAHYRHQRRREFLLGRCLLRLGLSRFVDPSREPSNWSLTEHTDLPPAIREADHWHFSISHSKGVVAVLLSETGPCGIDLEQCRPRRDYPALAEGWFHRDEISYLAEQSKREQTRYFYQRWTLKEAWIKRHQLSLFSGDMAKLRFDTTPTPATHQQSWLKSLSPDATSYSLTATLSSAETIESYQVDAKGGFNRETLPWEGFQAQHSDASYRE